MIYQTLTRFALGALLAVTVALASPGGTLLQRTVLGINSPDVAADLQLTPGQIQARNKLVNDFVKTRETLVNIMQKASEKEQEGYRDQIDSAEERMELGMIALLTPAQVKRLKELGIQQEGLVALQDDVIAKDLSLTSAQRSKMKAIYTKQMKAQDAYQEALGLELEKLPDPGSNPEAIKYYEAKQKAVIDSMKPKEKEFQAVKNAGDKQILGLLTPVQKAKWEKMKGKPFRGNG